MVCVHDQGQVQPAPFSGKQHGGRHHLLDALLHGRSFVQLLAGAVGGGAFAYGPQGAHQSQRLVKGRGTGDPHGRAPQLFVSVAVWLGEVSCGKSWVRGLSVGGAPEVADSRCCIRFSARGSGSSCSESGCREVVFRRVASHKTSAISSGSTSVPSSAKAASRPRSSNPARALFSVVSVTKRARLGVA